uniref:Uncharacterized protein n=1 Tax=Anguilla anguilla TaxID=7936 RepID=A0A0E9W639_ANGAN
MENHSIRKRPLDLLSFIPRPFPHNPLLHVLSHRGGKRMLNPPTPR